MAARKIFGPLVFAFLILSLPELYSQEQDLPGYRVILIVRDSIGMDNVPLNAVITDSIILEFFIRNFDVLNYEVGDRERMLTLGFRTRSSYLIEAEYSVVQGQLEIQIRCIRISDEAEIYSDSIRTRVGLDLDEEIQARVSMLIDLIEADIDQNPDLVTRLVYDEEVRESPPQERESNWPDVTAELSLFFPLGESAEYLSMGIVPRIRVHYPITLPFGELALGWSFSMNFISAQGDLYSSENIFTSTGPDILLKWFITEKIYLYTGLSGGVCIWMTNREDEGYQGMLLPSLIADAGAGWIFSDHVGFVAGAAFSIYPEESLNITGISPSVGVYFNI